MQATRYSLHRELPDTTFAEAVLRVTQALEREGFGILTRIDIRTTLREKLSVEHRPYLILGACNPALAHRALTANDSVGLLLPCNVVVAETDRGSEVAIGRPRAMLEISGDESVRPVADEAEERLARALADI